MVLLAQKWSGENPIGWWWSEKLDGVRAVWKDGKLRTRNGNVLYAPDWFVAGLPTETLDGELWVGPGQFQQTVSVVRRNHPDERWRLVRYMVFDLPALNQPFEERLRALYETMAPAAQWARAVVHQRLASPEELYKVLSEVKAHKGEGVMLRKPGSFYERRRSSTLLKVKTHIDSEALVIGYVEGKGKYAGQLGSLVCESPDGKRFHVGTGFTDKERVCPPIIGQVITFRYHEKTMGGIPREPRFVCERGCST